MVEEINHDRRRFLATPIMTIHTSYNDYEIVAAIFWRMTSDVSATASQPTPCTLIRRWAEPE